MVLTREECGRIHQAALDVLQHTGVRVDDQGIVHLLLDAGATSKSDGVVSIPEDLVRWAIGRAPRTVRIADRAGNMRDFTTGSGSLVLTGNALYYLTNGERRELTGPDLHNLARVAEDCANIHGVVGTSIADHPPTCRDFVGFRLMAQGTRKHLRPCIYTPTGGRLVMEMAQVLLDGTPLRERPIVSTGFSILSPLHWTSLALGVFRETAGLGVPVMINSEPLAGATAPVTLAGCLVIGDADTLSGLVINQLLEPGRPCVYNVGFAHVMDMSSGIALTGAPENALLQAAGADMARFHHLPSASWMGTESVLPDAQAAFEKMMTGLAHAQSGANLIWGAGNLESTLTMSPEALVMDDEIAGYFLRVQRGLSVDETSLATDLIQETGLAGDYLASAHTLAHHRTELSRSRLAFRGRRSSWEAEGGRSLGEAARDRVREILARDPEDHLDPYQLQELARIEAFGMKSLATTAGAS